MTLKQQQFTKHYTNLDNPITYGNGLQSVKAAYHYDNDNMSGVEAHRLLKTPKVIDAIEDIINKADLGPKVRLKALKEIINSTHVKTTVNTTRKGRKILYKSTSTTTPSAGEIIKAVDTIEKISGTYDKNKAKAEVVSAELKSLIKRHRKELSS